MLIDVGLPLSLAIIMFSLGFGLTFADFGRVLTMPKAVIVGILGQMVLVPLVALLLLAVFSLPPALAFGVMLLSFSPGGVTSNMLTKMGAGNVALSITLTAVVSLLAVLTMPLLVAWSAQRLLGEAGPEIDVTAIAVTMFAITAVPVFLGLLLRRAAPGLAERGEPLLSRVALVLFVIVVVGALAANWGLFVANVGHLAPLLVTLNVLLLALGLLLARLLGLCGGDARCISIEMGVQNATVAITVAGLIAGQAGIGEFAIPGAVYGITMYLVSIPLIYAMRAFGARA
ncbi:Sodium Bile acid symporter family protein [Pseudoruegeria aquimaris]|uniref:Sodium Bile acid symporter family protein n=1 Tax=Pseudoruegeria aquimaris TaxID=393663 RepID=A0A1Y5TIC0_9RHOB|nr:bile acid:sodium symporter [Pseudoruegeria aquimaris]SLN64646.1 Sodium Bile acid symporter family protein [Pseudoruegeria aquimaris]